MSSDKSDEFSLEGLGDLDLDENGEENDFSLSEDEGLDLDLSGEADDFLLSDEEVSDGPLQDLNEFSLTNVGINLSLAEESEESDALETFPSDEINLGDELKEEFILSEDDADISDELGDLFEQDSGSDDFSLEEDQGPAEELVAAPEVEGALSDFDTDDLFPTQEAAGDDTETPAPVFAQSSEDLTEDIKAKLKEIDAIMEEDATNAALNLSHVGMEETSEDSSGDKIEVDDFGLNLEDDKLGSDDLMDFDAQDDSLVVTLSDEDMFETDEPTIDESLVGDLNLSSLDLNEEEFIEEEEPVKTQVAAAPAAVAPKKKKKKEVEVEVEVEVDVPTQASTGSQSLDDISQAYSGEMERTQATISNLRADRDELLKRIDELEEEKLLSHRHHLSQRAELDEKKIELTIIRKKLNEEINDLKDRIRIFEERVLILEEKNKQLHQELDTAGQKNRIDVKRVMLRERELEQKLELLKADAETQIRNRDLKILELKRKIDGMEFDMESISQHEKKTLESRFELEDKLDKAIRTLRTAISTLEDDGNRSSTLEAIKKNIEV